MSLEELRKAFDKPVNEILASDPNLTKDEKNEVLQYGLDISNVRPDTIQKVTKSGAVSLLPTSLSDAGIGSVITKGFKAIDNLMYGSFAVPNTNWVGPLYSAGKTYAKNQIITPEDLNVQPTNKTDEIARMHDVEYQESSTKDSLKDRIEGLKEADRKFISRAEEALKNDQLTTYDRFLLNTSILAFKGKLATGLGYESSAKTQIKDPNAFQAGDILFNRKKPEFKREYKPRLIYNKRLPNKIMNLNNAESMMQDFSQYPEYLKNNIEYIDELDSLQF